MQVSMHAQHKQTCSTSELVPVRWSSVPVRSHFNGCSQKCYHNTILLLTSGSRETSAIFLKSSMETEVNSTRLRRPLSYKDWREERREERREGSVRTYLLTPLSCAAQTHPHTPTPPPTHTHPPTYPPTCCMKISFSASVPGLHPQLLSLAVWKVISSSFIL